MNRHAPSSLFSSFKAGLSVVLIVVPALISWACGGAETPPPQDPLGGGIGRSPFEGESSNVTTTNSQMVMPSGPPVSAAPNESPLTVPLRADGGAKEPIFDTPVQRREPIGPIPKTETEQRR